MSSLVNILILGKARSECSYVAVARSCGVDYIDIIVNGDEFKALRCRYKAAFFAQGYDDRRNAQFSAKSMKGLGLHG